MRASVAQSSAVAARAHLTTSSLENAPAIPMGWPLRAGRRHALVGTLLRGFRLGVPAGADLAVELGAVALHLLLELVARGARQVGALRFVRPHRQDLFQGL